MPKFTVDVLRTITHRGSIEVTAKNEDEAADKAESLVGKIDDWDFDDEEYEVEGVNEEEE